MIKVGLIGLGTVGGGVFELLQQQQQEIQSRLGQPVVVTHVAIRSPKPQYDLSQVTVSQDPLAVVQDPEVDMVVELIGGTSLAKTLVLAAIAAGKPVVTANKALIAEYGAEIFAAAQARGVTVAYEAAVAGGIPIIKALREGLAANQIQWLAGIINGTGNYILTEMGDKQRDFAPVLADAQALGYAEADPTFDVEGIDAAHKLTILASIAFGIPLNFKAIYTEGITQISQDDINNAARLGYRIKHLGIARRTADGIELRVHPTLIPEKQLLARVDDVMNAVLVKGHAVGPTLYYGAGAGAQPTASAVVADILDVVRGTAQMPGLGYHQLDEAPALLPIAEIETAYYLRVHAEDKPGVLADITRSLAEADISIEAIWQQESTEATDQVPIVILTQRTLERQLNTALQQIEQLPPVYGPVTRIRVESLSVSS